MDYTPAVLRNQGVPVLIAKLREEEGAWAPIFDSDGKPETEEFFVKFTHNTIADIEEVWDGLPDWQAAMADKPISTLRRTFGLLLIEPVEKVGLRLIEGRLGTYNNAVGTAWALANGVDPTVASRLLEQAEVATDSQIAMLNEELETTIDEVEADMKKVEKETLKGAKDTLGKALSPPGAKPTKGTKTSGKQAPPKS
tara:strand:+ start:327 stop:917 length:591 start_codon:yes stop_codon:yes gene_type:complete